MYLISKTNTLSRKARMNNVCCGKVVRQGPWVFIKTGADVTCMGVCNLLIDFAVHYMINMHVRWGGTIDYYCGVT